MAFSVSVTSNMPSSRDQNQLWATPESLLGSGAIDHIACGIRRTKHPFERDVALRCETRGVAYRLQTGPCRWTKDRVPFLVFRVPLRLFAAFSVKKPRYSRRILHNQW